MVVSIFFVLDKDGRERFYKKNVLLADIKPNIAHGISFLIMNNTNIDFQAWDI